MTYLATEMLLYLLSAAVIGLLLGWFIWGVGRRRELKAVSDRLTENLDSEITAHEETRHALAQADARTKQTVELAKSDAARSLGQLRQTIDKEREKAETAEAELARLRVEMEEAVLQGNSSDQAAIDEALRVANAEKAAAAEAMAKEAQSRAQIAELRLLIGAEKLAAEGARNELEQVRSGMQVELDAERAAHDKAKVALDDIRSTLAKTFGAEAANLVAGRADADEDVEPEPKNVWQGDVSGVTLGQGGKASSVAMTDIAAAGEALNNPDHDEADIEDREDTSLDLSPNIDVESVAMLQVEVDEAKDSDDGPIRAVPDRIELRPVPGTPIELSRPKGLRSQHPDNADSLQAIDGITPEIEERLYENGCYYYRHLAEMTASDIDWLAQAIKVTPYQIADDRWIQQAKGLILGDNTEGVDADGNQVLIDVIGRKNTG